MHNDLTFFTNEPERNLYDRFNKILESNTQFYDMIVGYFRTSGFYLMYPSMEHIEKIRVLVGLNVDYKTVQILEKSREQQMQFELSHKEVKHFFSQDVTKEMLNSEDSYNIEQGIKTFIQWLMNKKVEMRIYPDAQIHAKVYIMRKDMSKVTDQYGCVITGSSNFSQSGLINNLEFNVELKDSRDVVFALQKFEELWEKSIDISDEYVNTINKKTWLRQDITPYELYLKTLYEFFKEEINEDRNQIASEMIPDGFMRLQYQTDAVVQAKKILNAYNGVFIADVVGLGKTYICAMLAQNLKGRKLVICPPVLKDYWKRTLDQFDVPATVESLGKLDHILDNSDLMKNVKYVFVDEAHRFRNESTDSFQKLHQICYNKKVILISATPQNNYSNDIANQIYLFQDKNNSTIIPNNKNIELFFSKLDRSLNKNKKGSKEYSDVLKSNSKIIRDQVLRSIMIRRTRKEITDYYKEDLERQNLKFPQLGNPEQIIYTYNDEIEEVFNNTIQSIKDLTYARYKPLTYLSVVPKEIASLLISQKNMSGFMKSILVKRLESSFEAFRKTLDRFIFSYEKFLKMCEDGNVYISKKVNVYDLLDSGDDDKLMALVDEDSVQHYPIEIFNGSFIPAIKHDLGQLRNLKRQWEKVESDPKRDQFLKELKQNIKLVDKKTIIFTESTETAIYIGNFLSKEYTNEVCVFSGQSSQAQRRIVEANFNPSHPYDKKDDIKFLVTTDVLAEGINLHRSNVIINYDLPWNPTKIMQRVGRINRVGTEHDAIHVFNFFPTAQANMHLTLKDNITLKIQAFHDTLGEDFKYLSEDEEVSSHNLYEILTSKETLESENGDEESELKYLKIIRDIRDNHEMLYDEIKMLPYKAKCAKTNSQEEENQTITFLRKGALKKFFITSNEKSKELFFLDAIKYLESLPTEESQKIQKEYYLHLMLNKNQFDKAVNEEHEIVTERIAKRGNDAQVIKIIKAISACKKFTDDEDDQLQRMKQLWENGTIPASITKDVIKATKDMNDPVKIFFDILDKLPAKYLEERKETKKASKSKDSMVVLSSFLKKEEHPR